MSYSHELVTIYQEYMRARCGVRVSCDQAQLDIESFAGLYLAFTDSGANDLKQGRSASAEQLHETALGYAPANGASQCDTDYKQSQGRSG